ncbi:MAG: thioredoxin family protein [Clostridia bacterium]|nr:thioredoxin family protein [Clostridia bacterium]
MNEDIILVDSYDLDVRIENGFCAVLFYSQFCVHSRGLIPIIEEIADEYYDYMRFYALDVEQSPDAASVFAVETTPTVIFFRNGKIIERITGANPPSAYTEVIEDVIAVLDSE